MVHPGPATADQDIPQPPEDYWDSAEEVHTAKTAQLGPGEARELKIQPWMGCANNQVCRYFETANKCVQYVDSCKAGNASTQNLFVINNVINIAVGTRCPNGPPGRPVHDV